MATTSLPAKQTFDAPSPYITAAGNSLDNVLPGYVKVPASGDLPAYAVFQDEIRTSPNDDRAYRCAPSRLLSSSPVQFELTLICDRLILLPNGIEALLISDPTTDKASAAIDVKAGHLNDPEDLPGLAHFCEHLMFMGTEKVSPLSRLARPSSCSCVGSGRHSGGEEGGVQRRRVFSIPE